MQCFNKKILYPFIRPPMLSNLFFLSVLISLLSFFCDLLNFVHGQFALSLSLFPTYVLPAVLFTPLIFFYSKVKVLYGGTELFDDEVRRTFHSDMLLALFSGGCIAVLVYILTSFSCKACMHFSA